MIATIANNAKTAARRVEFGRGELKIDINPKNGQLQAGPSSRWWTRSSNPRTEIHIEKARAVKPGAVLGEMIERPIDPSSWAGSRPRPPARP